MQTDLRETSFRKVKAVIDLPESQEWIDTKDVPVFAHYLRVGNGFFAYAFNGGTAHMHALLHPKDDRSNILKDFAKHKSYLFDRGISRIDATINSAHKRARFMANTLGFQLIRETTNKVKYEIILWR